MRWAAIALGKINRLYKKRKQSHTCHRTKTSEYRGNRERIFRWSITFNEERQKRCVNTACLTRSTAKLQFAFDLF